MVSRYEILKNVLDDICRKAPEKNKCHCFDGMEEEKLNQARARAYIHLFLLVKFGVQTIEERDKYITDDKNDGGIDAYYISEQDKIIYLIQSKFRATESNFADKKIDSSELVAMDIQRIEQGEETAENGVKYNGKIRSYQSKLQKLKDLSDYSHEIVILANISKENQKLVKRLFPGYKYEVFDSEKSFRELVFPYTAGTYYTKASILIEENVDEVVNVYENRFNNTSYGACRVIIFYAPASFVAKFVEKYKNSLLQYNPRNYLTLTKNAVNSAIVASLRANNEDFALLNNGITLFCKECKTNAGNGMPNSTYVKLLSPQVINGGQTAVTLTKLYGENPGVLDGKKVLLRIIEVAENNNPDNPEKDLAAYLGFINSVSNATNMQTAIDEADRRSNLKIQCDFQQSVFMYCGLLYERKQGEFEAALSSKILPRDQIIKRDTLVRCLWAINGESAKAMSDTKNSLFSESNLNTILMDTIPAKAVFAYYSYVNADSRQRKKTGLKKEWGNGTRYGKFALLKAEGILCKDFDWGTYSFAEIKNQADIILEAVLSNWADFEDMATKKASNKAYFDSEKNFANYYKSKNSEVDVSAYWSTRRLTENNEITTV